MARVARRRSIAARTPRLALLAAVLWVALVTPATGQQCPAPAFYALLPVLRNTIVGLQSVDASLGDAGRGIGMSGSAVLLRIEMPLAVPFILAGLRSALVLAVGTATLALFVGAGGLGELIDTGYKLNDYTVMIVGSVLAMALALLVDWLGALAETYLSPRGLR